MKMKKKLASVLTVIMLACSLPWQAQAAAPIVSNKPHKAPVATPPAVSEAQPVRRCRSLLPSKPIPQTSLLPR